MRRISPGFADAKFGGALYHGSLLGGSGAVVAGAANTPPRARREIIKTLSILLTKEGVLKVKERCELVRWNQLETVYGWNGWESASYIPVSPDGRKLLSRLCKGEASKL